MTILAILAVIALGAWCYLALGHGWFWRTDVRLPPANPPAAWPPVAVVVPARNEAAMLPLTLPGLLAQDYPGRWEIVLVDDRITDGTAAVARRCAAGAGRQVTIVSGSDPPPGWTGKLWALRQGLAALNRDADVAPPELVLFTDADIAHPAGSLRRLVAAAQAGSLDVVSLMARLPARLRWERLLIPAFVYFFAQLYPFRRVNRPPGRAGGIRIVTAAAAGGCLLVRLDALQRAGGLEKIGGALIDDVALARLIKRAGGSIWLGLGDDVHSCRPYERLADIWGMVARSAFTQLRHSLPLLTLTVAGLALVYLIPPMAALAGGIALAARGRLAADIALGAGAAGWLLMAATYAPMVRHHGRPAIAALLLPLTAAFYLLMTVDSARRHLLSRGGEWKGRRY